MNFASTINGLQHHHPPRGWIYGQKLTVDASPLRVTKKVLVSCQKAMQALSCMAFLFYFPRLVKVRERISLRSKNDAY